MRPLRKPLILAAIALAGVSAARQPAEDVDSYGWGEDPSLDGSIVVIATRPKPATALEALLLTRGVLVSTAFSELGTFSAENGAAVRLLAADVRGGPTRAAGIVIEVRNRTTRAIGYIDAAEAQNLLATLRDLARADRAGTGLQFAAAQFTTPGNVAFANRDVAGSRLVSLRTNQVLDSGRVVAATATFRVGAFSQFLQQFEAAGRVLDNLGGGGRPDH